MNLSDKQIVDIIMVMVKDKLLADHQITLKYLPREEAEEHLKDGFYMIEKDRLERIVSCGAFCFEKGDSSIITAAIHFVEIYRKTSSFQTVSDAIMSCVEKDLAQVHDMDFINKDFIRENLVLELKPNDPELKELFENAALSVDFFGLKVIPRLIVSSDENHNRSTILDKEVLNDVFDGISDEEILEIALNNITGNYPVCCSPMDEDSFFKLDNNCLHIVGSQTCGASIVLFKDEMKKMLDHLNADDCYLISYNSDYWLMDTSLNEIAKHFDLETDCEEMENLRDIHVKLLMDTVKSSANLKNSNQLMDKVLFYKKLTNDFEVIG